MKMCLHPHDQHGSSLNERPLVLPAVPHLEKEEGWAPSSALALEQETGPSLATEWVLCGCQAGRWRSGFSNTTSRERGPTNCQSTDTTKEHALRSTDAAWVDWVATRHRESLLVPEGELWLEPAWVL